MENKMILISYKRFMRCLKKYRVLVFFFAFVSICAFCWGVTSNQKKMSEEQNAFEYQKTILFVSEYLSNSYIEDFRILVSTDEFMQEVCGSEKELNVQTERLEGSNCVSITVMAESEKEAKEIADKIVREGKNLFNSYYPEIEIAEIESQYLSENSSEITFIQMKDILMLLLPILVGIFLIYILMLLDERFYDRKELENYLNLPVNEYTREECMAAIINAKESIVILGRNLDDFKDIELKVVPLESYVRKKEGVGEHKILIVKKECITVKELEEYTEVLQRDVDKECKVFLVNV